MAKGKDQKSCFPGKIAGSQISTTKAPKVSPEGYAGDYESSGSSLGKK